MRVIHKETQRAVRREGKPQARTFLVWDTDAKGLALQVQPSGYRSYKCVYRFGGSSQWITLGDARVLGLADARKRAAALMLDVLNGKDPASERRTGRQSKATFAHLANRYLEEYAKRKNKSWRQADALIRRWALPTLGSLDATTISRSDVRSLLAKVSAPVLQNQILASASAIFAWAGKQEIVGNNPCRGVERNATVSRERVLSDAELPLFWKEFGNAGIPGIALKVLLLTGQRPGEISAMHHSHIRADWWEMPGLPEPATGWLGTKTGRAHRVWLSQPVRALIAELGDDEASGFVFEKPPPLAIVMRDICKQLGMPRATPHDLRRTFGTTTTSCGFTRDTMDRLLNHTQHGVGGVYDRYGYSRESQHAWETVASRLLALATGATSNVVSFTPPAPR